MTEVEFFELCHQTWVEKSFTYEGNMMSMMYELDPNSTSSTFIEDFEKWVIENGFQSIHYKGWPMNLWLIRDDYESGLMFNALKKYCNKLIGYEKYKELKWNGLSWYGQL